MGRTWLLSRVGELCYAIPLWALQVSAVLGSIWGSLEEVGAAFFCREASAPLYLGVWGEVRSFREDSAPRFLGVSGGLRGSPRGGLRRSQSCPFLKEGLRSPVPGNLSRSLWGFLQGQGVSGVVRCCSEDSAAQFPSSSGRGTPSPPLPHSPVDPRPDLHTPYLAGWPRCPLGVPQMPSVQL